jgi:RNase P subunit RPR2
MSEGKLKEVLCAGCQTFLGRRLGNRLIAFGIDVLFSRSANLTCHKCGKDTVFPVHRRTPPQLAVSQAQENA